MGWFSLYDLDAPIAAALIADKLYAIGADGSKAVFEKDKKEPAALTSLDFAKGSLAAKIKPSGEAIVVAADAAYFFSIDGNLEPGRVVLSKNPIVKAAIDQGGDHFAAIDREGFLQIFSDCERVYYAIAEKRFKKPTALFFGGGSGLSDRERPVGLATSGVKAFEQAAPKPAAEQQKPTTEQQISGVADDRRYLFVADSDKSAVVFDLLLRKIIFEFELNREIVGGVFCKNGKLLLFSSEGEATTVSFHARGKDIDKLHVAKVAPNAAFTDERFAFIGSQKGILAAYDMRHERIARSWKSIDDNITYLFLSGDYALALGEKRIACFNLRSLNEALELSLETEDYAAANALVAQSGFALLNEDFCEKLDSAWEENALPRVVSYLEDGHIDLARDLVSAWSEDIARRGEFEELLRRHTELLELRKAMKNRDLKSAETLLVANPALKDSVSGKLFFTEWENAVNQALQRLENSAASEAETALADFKNAGEKGEIAAAILSDPQKFIKAAKLFSEAEWHAFYDYCEAESACKGLPHYAIFAARIAALENEMIFCADNCLYMESFRAAELLIELGVSPAIHDEVAACQTFAEAAKRLRLEGALAIVDRYPFLTDTPQFRALFSEIERHFARAWAAAIEGDSEAARLLLDKYNDFRLFDSYAANVLRVAYTEHMRRINVSGALDWLHTAHNYTDYFGRDPLLDLAYDAQGEGELLNSFAYFLASKPGYHQLGLPKEVLAFVNLTGETAVSQKPKETDEPKKEGEKGEKKSLFARIFSFSRITEIIYSAMILIVAFFFFWLITLIR
ncbi:MAG: hypothetical protein LBU73_09135 [Helicobacteraceae bacterium]|nr:hypothetical protein [Helicobacteraceae bacterium]